MRATLSAGLRKGLPLIVLLAFLGFVVPAVVSAGLVWLQGHAADRLVNAQEGKLLANEAVKLAERLRAFVEPSEQDLAFVAGLSHADILFSDDPNRIERFLFERARTRAWIRSVFLFLERDDRLIAVSPSLDGTHWQILRQGFGREPVTELRAVNEDFDLLSREVRPTDELNPRQRPWYGIVRPNGRPAWTRPYRLYPSGLAGVTVVAPLMGGNQVRIGIVGTTLRLVELDRFLRSLTGHGEGGFAVVDRDGGVLGSSSSADDMSAAPMLVQRLATDAVRLLAGTDERYALVGALGAQHLVSIARLGPRSDALFALVHAPAGSTLRAFVAGERTVVLAIAAGFVLAATSLTFLVWRWVALPLAGARRFAVAQGKGEAPPTLAPGPLVELRQLGRTLLGMSREIAARREQESKLRESLASSNGRLEALLAGAPLAVIELVQTDFERRVVRWQGRAGPLFGHEAAEVEGRDLADIGLVPPTDQDELDAMLRVCVEIGWAEAAVAFVTRTQDVRLGRWYAARVATHTNETRLLLLVHDETDRAAAFATIDRMAREDALTGLANRWRFLDLLDQAIGQASRRREGLAVWSLDLDDFKGVNDAYGHGDGDEVLRELGLRLRNLVRSSDAVARFGGDEFMLVQTEVQDPQEANAFGMRLREALMRPFMVSGHPLAVTCGIGLALYPADAATAPDLLRRSDLALLAAKAGGRGQLRRFQPELEAAKAGRRALEERLRRAVQQARLELAFQPIWRITPSLRLVAAEALLRWEDEGELVPPGVFVPLAEESDLIHELGDLVVRLGARQLQRWAAEGFSLPLALNLSPAQLRRAGFAERLLAIVKESGAASSSLHLEITETLFLESSEAVAQLTRLQDTGFALAIDDFGTGDVSLASLVRLRPRWLKIDRCFIADMSSNPRSLAITRAVVGLARSLGIDAVAEGVETEEQLEMLRAIGCPLAQGFLLGHPSSPGALRETGPAAYSRRPDPIAVEPAAS